MKKFGVFPHAYHLYISLYRNRQRGMIAKVLSLPGMRSLAAVFSIVAYKYAAGILVLRK